MSEFAFLACIKADSGWADDESLGKMWHSQRTYCAELDHGIMPDFIRSDARFQLEQYGQEHFLRTERQLAEVKLGIIHAEIKARLGVEVRRFGPWLGMAGVDRWADEGWLWELATCMNDEGFHKPVPPEWLDVGDGCCIDVTRCRRMIRDEATRSEEYEARICAARGVPQENF